MTKGSRITVLVTAACLAAAGVSILATAAGKPDKNQGLEDARLQQFPLTVLAAANPGYDLRARRVVLAGGGAVTEHSHADRPGIVYILEGSLTEHRGEVARVVKAGDSWAEDANTVHWMENTSDKPCVFLAVDLVKK